MHIVKTIVKGSTVLEPCFFYVYFTLILSEVSKMCDLMAGEKDTEYFCGLEMFDVRHSLLFSSSLSPSFLYHIYPFLLFFPSCLTHSDTNPATTN